ncbi:MAG: NAD-dependent epimerase/dehydratase family protein [Marinifilaceae bacterium]|jgi:nucleoside-diphosphate-sugar epimerase|nr:NAD-dependent epimerase/dehydratase family protein [Marinilabiliaceae bacterium JC040]MCT4600343.1 NAD-dependent epimerase/dehydratase family protein [Marinifilaceae bacterium]
MKNILVIGAGGQIGSELVPYLRNIYGTNNVVAADIDRNKCKDLAEQGPFEEINALDGEGFTAVVKKHKIDTIYNLVALLSATGEKDPLLAWKINMGALTNSLNIAKDNGCAVFTPSSIGAFGDNTPKDNTPQDTIQRSSSTIYGVCKVSGELLSDYYFNRFGVDTRSVRFPGIISYVQLPGGGTTDYAVEIYYDAIRKGSFTSNIQAGTYMDMMYMPDALRAAVSVMEADPSKLIHRNSFNIASMSFEPEQIAAEIKKHIPNFTMDYKVDEVKQAIANSWPNKMDDSCAAAEWGWKAEYDLTSMTPDMLAKVKEKFDKGLIK